MFCLAGAQFWNGATERLVTKFKRTLEHKFGKAKHLSMIKMAVAMKIVASMVISRPLHARYDGLCGCPEPDFLTPNTLLTGRCIEEVPLGNYDLTSRPMIVL